MCLLFFDFTTVSETLHSLVMLYKLTVYISLKFYLNINLLHVPFQKPSSGAEH